MSRREQLLEIGFSENGAGSASVFMRPGYLRRKARRRDVVAWGSRPNTEGDGRGVHGDGGGVRRSDGR